MSMAYDVRVGSTQSAAFHDNFPLHVLTMLIAATVAFWSHPESWRAFFVVFLVGGAASGFAAKCPYWLLLWSTIFGIVWWDWGVSLGLLYDWPHFTGWSVLVFLGGFSINGAGMMAASDSLPTPDHPFLGNLIVQTVSLPLLWFFYWSA